MCKHCQSITHASFQCYTQRKPIKKQSAKQIEYERWLKKEVGPALIARDGYQCVCCKRSDRPLDKDHLLTKGSRPDLKRSIENLVFRCRECHRNRTDHRECEHI